MIDKSRSSISFKFMIIMCIIVILSGGIIISYILFTEQKQSDKQTTERITTINEIIAKSAYQIMATGTTTAKTYINNLLSLKVASNIRLIKSRGVEKQYGASEEEKVRDNDDAMALRGIVIKKDIVENGIRYVKQMTPLEFDTGCLDCHKGTPGEIAAAISVMISLQEIDIATKKRHTGLAVIIIFGGIFVMIIIFYFVNLFIVNPIKQVSDVANLIAVDGNLISEIKVNTNDEIGQLAECFNNMVNNLRQLVGNIQDASLRISAASTEFLASSENQTVGAGKQAASISAIAATIEELSGSASQIAENANSVVKIAEQTLRRAEAGQNAVMDMINGMDDIKNKFQQTSEKIGSLGEQSKVISEIVDIIDDVANQTKLLSLNAAIEAAKAGEYGKGFAIVAVEIRQLADNVVRSTTKIKNIINEIQSSTNASVIASEQSMEGIENGVKLARKAGEALQYILEIAERTAESANQIGISTQQQKGANEMVVVTMREISNITQQLAAGVREQTITAGELNKLSEELKKVTGRFKTKY